MSSSLLIEKLILVGTRKNYEIPFNPGVNIIYGDSDTGKSSILEFINYLLGSSSIDLADEISTSVEYAALEISIDNLPYTIKRDIFKPRNLIEVYQCIFTECTNFVPEKYSPNYSIKSKDGYFSDFLLDKLNLPKVEIKVAPSKENSQTKRLSFRNLFKYSYIDQDNVGSKNFLDLEHGVKLTTNKEVFKYIFNVLDSSITELESEISEKAIKRNSERQKYKSVSDFLRETNYESIVGIDDSIEDIDSEIDTLEGELLKLNSSMTEDSENYLELKSIFNELTLNEKGTSKKISHTQNLMDKYTRLKNDYENDISKIESIKNAKERLGVEVNALSSCPICENEYKIDPTNIDFDVTPVNTLDEELKSLSIRKKNIADVLSSQTIKYKKLMKENSIYIEDIKKAREMLDIESKEMITPYLSQRDFIIKEISTLRQKRKSYVENLKIRNQQEKIYRNYQNLEDAIVKLNERLSILKDKAPSLDSVTSKFGDLMRSYLTDINIKNRTAIGISNNTFTPIIRNKEYKQITSGGLRTIASIGYMLNMLKYSIEGNINHPNLLLIDTVGKYLGKTTKSEKNLDADTDLDPEEGISDPLKYKNIYESIIKVANLADEKGVICQIILVDNDVPPDFIESYKGFIVAHYESTGKDGLQMGLIDDVPSQVQ